MKILKEMVKVVKNLPVDASSALKMGLSMQNLAVEILKVRVTGGHFSVPRHGIGSRFALRKMDFIY